MATNKSRLARDPNVPDDDASLARRLGEATRAAGIIGRYAAGQVSDALQAPARAVLEGGRQFYSGLVDEPAPQPLPDPAAAAAPAPPTRSAPLARDPLTAEQRAKDVEFGTRAGQGAAGFLAERKRLAPGVRRYGGSLADPSDVYVTVDKNGNRVYTDDAQFAAGKSRGSLTRRDLAPGLSEADAKRTLEDPEGGFTYAKASPSALKDLQDASSYTFGRSKRIERALGEAQRAQDIADTRAGTRPIDKQREQQAQANRKLLGLETGGNLSLRDLIALQANDRAERQFTHQVENDNTVNGQKKITDDRDNAKFLSEQLARVKKGELDARELLPLLSTLPPEQAQKVTYQLRRSQLQRALTDYNPWFGLGAGEIGKAEPSSIRKNPDGSGTYVEPKSGFFGGIDRNISLSPEDMVGIYGDPEDEAAARERELSILRQRGL